MRSNISLQFFFIVISMNERVQNGNQIQRSLEMVLDIKEVMNSFSRILQDSIKMSESILDKHIIAFHFFDDFKESANHTLSRFFIRFFIEDMSLLNIISSQEGC